MDDRIPIEIRIFERGEMPDRSIRAKFVLRLPDGRTGVVVTQVMFRKECPCGCLIGKEYDEAVIQAWLKSNPSGWSDEAFLWDKMGEESSKPRLVESPTEFRKPKPK
jgi:hypothetical protein